MIIGRSQAITTLYRKTSDDLISSSWFFDDDLSAVEWYCTSEQIAININDNDEGRISL